jgi:hypothetical protein
MPAALNFTDAQATDHSANHATPAIGQWAWY